MPDSGRAGATALPDRATEFSAVEHEQTPHALKRSSVRGVLASCIAQAANLALRIISMVVLARLLSPADFGLVSMVTAVTGILFVCKEAGLSNAAVQTRFITDDQLSTLFWINMALGFGLAGFCALAAPILSRFYGEPRLFWIAVISGTAFVFHGLGAQHRTILLRRMRIPTVSAIDIASLVLSIAVSVTMAATGFGYWSLVASTVIVSAGGALGVWLIAGWIPRRPRRGTGLRRMLVYGGTVTLNSVAVYIAYNADKVLLGRFSGAETLGLYTRAYQLINLPTDGLHSAIGSVAFPALSRVHEDPIRFRTYFLRIYSIFISLLLPLTMACALFATDIVQVFLGPQWAAAAPVFRLLAPTILVFSLINPFGWLMFANGQVKRSLLLALMIAAVTIPAYCVGLGHGAHGVATGFSVAMVLIALPLIYWATRGTLITMGDTFRAVRLPAASVLIASAATYLALPWFALVQPTLLKLTIACTLFFSVYILALLFLFRQSSVYVQLLQQAGIWPLSGRLATSKHL